MRRLTPHLQLDGTNGILIFSALSAAGSASIPTLACQASRIFYHSYSATPFIPCQLVATTTLCIDSGSFYIVIHTLATIRNPETLRQLNRLHYYLAAEKVSRPAPASGISRQASHRQYELHSSFLILALLKMLTPVLEYPPNHCPASVTGQFHGLRRFFTLGEVWYLDRNS